MLATFVFCLVGAVAGAAVGLLVAHAHHRIRNGAGVGVGVVIGIVVALVLQALMQAIVTTPTAAVPEPPAQSTSPQEPGPSTVEDPTVEPSEPQTSSSPSSTDESETADPSEVASEPTPDDPPSSTVAGDETYYIGELDAVATEKEGRPGQCTGGCTGFQYGSSRIAGEVFPSSYLMRIDTDGRRSTATFNAARSCSVFEATVGVGDSSVSSEVTFTIAKDGGQPKRLARVGLAEPVTVESDLKGIAQFEIAAYVSGDPVDGAVRAVWGDARVTCRSGSLGN